MRNRCFKMRTGLVAAILVLAICVLTACGGTETDSGEAVFADMTVLELFESMQDNDAMPFEITEKAKEMLDEHPELFNGDGADQADAYTDFTLEYKMLTKNIDNYGSELIYISEALVISIDETELDEETIFTEMHLMDANENSYYVLCPSAYDDIFEDDIVSCYGLPLGETSFENIGGGTTLAIVFAGSYIEKLEY